MKTRRFVLDFSRQRDRGIAAFAAALSGVALLTSVVGLYGVFARMLERRKRELSVRLALGATARSVVGLVVVDAAAVAAAGVAAGLAVSHVTAPALASLLFGVDPHDPSAMLVAVGTLVATVVVACFVPARRASQVDPATTLRAE